MSGHHFLYSVIRNQYRVTIRNKIYTFQEISERDTLNNNMKTFLPPI